MTDEALSALLDGECTPAEVDRLLAELERKPALKARFSRMALARESLQGTRIRALEPEFSSRVMAALDRGAGTSTVVPFPSRAVPKPALAWRPAAGLAAAAAIAAVAVLAVRPGTSPDMQSAPGLAAVAESPVGVLRPDADPGYRRWAQIEADHLRELNTYFFTYTSTRAQQGMGGSTLGYARYAANPGEEAQAESRATRAGDAPQ